MGVYVASSAAHEVPLAAWRVHATACELYQNSGDRELAQRHFTLSREAIMKLADSLAGKSLLPDIP
jgi:hypothetical protein